MRPVPALLKRAPLVALLAAAACSAAAGPGPVCGGPGACASGAACVAGRCRASDEAPAPADAQRVLLAPADLAVLSSAQGAGVPENGIALGRQASGATVVLLRFAATWRDDADIVSAFVLLEPAEAVRPAASPIAIEIARILEPWRSEDVSWGRQPRLALPEVAALARPRPAAPLRVDVTRIVRGWGKRRGEEHGIALLARAEDPWGAVVSSGVASGEPPRLEVYLR